MRFLVSGPPSSGKSTQGRRLAAALGVPHVSSGELIRAAAGRGDPRDVALLKFVSDGSLAPSGPIAAMVLKRLSRTDCAGGFVLDGFPRREIEAAVLGAEIRPIDALLVLEADQDALLERLRRRIAEGRADDDPANFPRRMAAFASQTRAAHAILEGYGIPLVRIDAAGPADQVAERIERAVDRLQYRPAGLRTA